MKPMTALHLISMIMVFSMSGIMYEGLEAEDVQQLVNYTVAEAKQKGENYYYQTIFKLKGKVGVTKFLRPYLGERDPLLRMVISESLGWESERENLLLLSEVLSDKDENVRRVAIQTILLNYDSHFLAQNVEIIEKPLARYLAGDDTTSFKAALVLLKIEPSEGVLTEIRKQRSGALESGKETTNVAYMDSVLAANGDAEARERIVQELSSTDTKEIILGIELLAATGRPSLASSLLQLLEDKTPARNVAPSHMRPKHQRICDIAAASLETFYLDPKKIGRYQMYRIFSEDQLQEVRKNFVGLSAK